MIGVSDLGQDEHGVTRHYTRSMHEASAESKTCEHGFTRWAWVVECPCMACKRKVADEVWRDLLASE
jgi:hypothetical protein